VKKPVQNRLSTSLWLTLAAASLGAFSSHAQTPAAPKGATAAKTVTPPPAPAGAGSPARVVSGTDFSTIGPVLNIVVGNSTLIRFPSPIERISLGNPAVADVTLISPLELYRRVSR